MKLTIDRWNTTVFLFLVTLTGFIVGYIHHSWFYPLTFHGDSSAMQVLAQAMLDERSLIPRDFIYGNQLILTRSSLFIAMVLGTGASGYDAYILGSSISVAFWFVVLYLSLFKLIGKKIDTLILCTVFFIPIGHWDNECIVGQHSHLSNAILSIGIGVFIHNYFSTGRVFSAFLAAFFIFIMVVEAPIRALLVFFPLTVLILVLFHHRNRLWLIIFLSSIILVGFLVNKVLVSINPPIFDHFLFVSFHSTIEIFHNLVNIFLETIANISSINLFASKKISFLGMILVAGGLAYTILLVGFFLYQSRLLFSKFIFFFSGNQVSDCQSGHQFLSFLAVFGLFSGALAISILNPDSARHYFWAYSILKLSLIISIYKYLQRVLKGRLEVGPIIISLAVIASLWSATLFQHGLSLRQKVASVTKSDISIDIARISQQYDIRHIYGEDFWRMMPFNTLIPGLSSGTLLIEDNDKIIPYYWLSRRSWFDYNEKVLYYLKDGPVDNVTKEMLNKLNGRILHSYNDGSIWIGPPVWSPRGHNIVNSIGESFKWAACQLSTKIGEKTDSCEIEKKELSQSGHLTFGPYVKLSTGRYTFEITYSSSESSSKTVGEWDVHLSRPESGEVLDKGKIYGSDNKTVTIKKSFMISPSRDMEKVEIRTFAHPNGPLKMISLQITKNK